MNYEEALSSAIVRQGIKLKVSEIPFNIFLKNTNDILTLCFLEEETEDYLSIVETTDYGVEEVRIIPKENIEYVSIFYDFAESKEEPVDRMII